MNENILVFDTETISLNKQFIYNLGYVVADGNGKTLVARDLVIRQVWDNKELFATAYYSFKKPIYVKRMRAKKTQKVSWGEACRIMLKDIKTYGVKNVYAYNSRFDEKAFYFNHLWYRNKRQPLNGVIVNDIMDFIKPIVETQEYKDFCIANGFITKHSTPRAQRTAESVYAYITQNSEYKEEHTALEDSKIELAILLESWKRA